MAAQENTKKAEDNVPTYEVLEEDDEFEEFADKDWDETAEDPAGSAQFEEDWDDTEIDDDFTNQLRKELSQTNK